MEPTDPKKRRADGVKRVTKTVNVDETVWDDLVNTAGHLGINLSHAATEAIINGLPIVKTTWIEDTADDGQTQR